MLAHLTCFKRLTHAPIVLVILELLSDRVVHKIAESVSSSLRQQLEVIVGPFLAAEWLRRLLKLFEERGDIALNG